MERIDAANAAAFLSWLILSPLGAAGGLFL
jgi:hypothetical protein